MKRIEWLDFTVPMKIDGNICVRMSEMNVENIKKLID